MVVYIICCIFGVMIGCVCTILFFQSDKAWLKIISTILGISGTGSSYLIIKKITGETNKEVLQIGFAVLLISILGSVFVTLLVLCKVLKDENGNEVIRIRDILLGQKDYIKSYYEQRIKEIEAKSNSKALENERREIDAIRAELLLKEQDLNCREEKLNEQIKQHITLQLPIDAPVPVTNEFLGQFPDFIEGLAKFINDVNRITEEYLSKITEDSRQNYNIIYSYFLGICSFMMEDIFDASSKNVRIHFRVLHDNEYVKFVAKIGKLIYEDELTPIPKEKGMIKKAYINQTSLIKSLNSHYNFKSKNRNVWEDYMTITFYDICKDGIPFISMGISVKNKERFKHLLYFLNFYKIENFLQENLRKVDKVFDIVNTVENNYSSENNGGAA